MRLLSLMALMFACAMPLLVSAQPVWTGPNSRSLTFKFGNFDALDQDGFVIGKITNLVVTLVEGKQANGNLVTLWNVDFDYYNGCCGMTHGTHGAGYTPIVFGFNNTNGPPILDSFWTPIDQGHCIYGRPEHQHTSGIYNNYIDLVTVSPPLILRFIGDQGKC